MYHFFCLCFFVDKNHSVVTFKPQPSLRTTHSSLNTELSSNTVQVACDGLCTTICYVSGTDMKVKKKLTLDLLSSRFIHQTMRNRNHPKDLQALSPLPPASSSHPQDVYLYLQLGLSL